MKFVQWEFNTSAGDVVEVELSRQANVRLMSPGNFQRCRREREGQCYGGLAKFSQFVLLSRVKALGTSLSISAATPVRCERALAS
jgi:hypothetical protein